jgi:hypothetical protein
MVANIGEDFVRVNMKSWLNLRKVKAFELVGDDDRARMAERYAGANVDNFIWTVRKVDDSSFSLARQKAGEDPMAYLRRLTGGRMLVMETQPGAQDGRQVATRVVPLAAVLNLEHINEADRAGMAASYQETDRAHFDDKKTRIRYREIDPRTVTDSDPRGKQAQKTFAVSIRDLREQGLNIVALHNGRFVLASEVHDALGISDAEKQRLEQRGYATVTAGGETFASRVVLRGGEERDWILSPLSPDQVAAACERDLPSVSGVKMGADTGAEAEDVPWETGPDAADDQPAPARGGRSGRGGSRSGKGGSQKGAQAQAPIGDEAPDTGGGPGADNEPPQAAPALG